MPITTQTPAQQRAARLKRELEEFLATLPPEKRAKIEADFAQRAKIEKRKRDAYHERVFNWVIKTSLTGRKLPRPSE